MENDTFGSKVKNLMGRLIPKNKAGKIQWKKPLMAFLMVVIVGVTGYLVYENGFSYEVRLDGKNVGFIKNEETLGETLTIVEEDVTKEYGEDAYFSEKAEMERVRGHNKELVELEELRERIIQKVEVLKPASIIAVDGKERVIVGSKERAKAVLEEIKKPYIREKEEEDVEVLEISFNQEIEIIDEDVPVDLIVSERDALLVLGERQDRKKVHKVSRGDTVWDISRFSNVDIDKIEKANPDIDIENLKPGEELNITLPESLLEVVSVERHTSKDSIDFETEEKNDSSIYIGEKEIGQEGEKGEKEILREFTYVNGIETENEIIKETVVEEPKNKIILVGTKERPAPVVAQTSSSTQAPARRTQTTTARTTTQAAPKKQAATQQTSTPVKHNGDLGSAIVATARKYLGTPYRYGGSSPSGFDCSGFTSFVYRQHGISIPRTADGQGRSGAYVPRDQLRPGDILAFTKNGNSRFHHAGIYVGGGNFIHSPYSGKTVEIKSLSSYGGTLSNGRRPY